MTLSTSTVSAEIAQRLQIDVYSDLLVSMDSVIKKFVGLVDKAGSAETWSDTKGDLYALETYRESIFGRHGQVHEDGSVSLSFSCNEHGCTRAPSFFSYAERHPDHDLDQRKLHLSKMNGRYKSVQRMLKQHDDPGSGDSSAEYCRLLGKTVAKLLLLMFGDTVDERPIFRKGAYYFYGEYPRPDHPWTLPVQQKVIQVLHDGWDREILEFRLDDRAQMEEFYEEIGWPALIDASDDREDDDYEESGKRED